MKKNMLFGVLLCLMSNLLFSCQLNEEKVISDIEKVLAENHFHVFTCYDDGVATLYGIVENNRQKLEAEKVVRSVKYVKTVDNRINIQSPSQKVMISRDHALREHICSQLSENKCDDIRVHVEDGEILLEGNLDRENLLKVMKITRGTNPKKIMTNLTFVSN